ncbi:MAG: flagellar biosynthesis protein FlgN [Rectinemataceae bacterium]
MGGNQAATAERGNADGLEQRVAVLRRFRELLSQQRDKFERYLVVLDHEHSDIECGDVDSLVAHVDLESQIVSEIFTFQKVIDPLEDLYRAAYPSAAVEDVSRIEAALLGLRTEVSARNAENRLLLKRRMEMLRGEIAGFRNPLAARKSVFASNGEGGLLNIEG